MENLLVILKNMEENKNNLDVMKELNAQVRELSKKTKTTNDIAEKNINKRIDDAICDICKYILIYDEYMKDICKGMDVNHSYTITLNHNDALSFTFQNLKTATGIMCRKYFTVNYRYCGTIYTTHLFIRDDGSIYFEREINIDKLLENAKEVIIKNEKIIRQEFGKWVEDLYFKEIEKKIDKMKKEQDNITEKYKLLDLI